MSVPRPIINTVERRMHDDEELRRVAALSTCMAEFLQRLDGPVTPGRRRHRWSRLRNAGIDLAHWDKSPKRWYTRERLAEAVAASTSYAGVLRHLGIPQAGGSQACLARRIRDDGLDTTHFRGQAHMRGARAPRRDNRLANLRFLCPNCHAQTATWCRKKGP